MAVVVLKPYLKFHSREKRMVKKFAYLPKGLMSGEKVLWEPYYEYQIFHAGFITDGEVITHKKGKDVWHTAKGSKFPTKYIVEFESKHIMGVRKFFRNGTWVTFQREMRKRDERAKAFEKIFGKDVAKGRI